VDGSGQAAGDRRLLLRALRPLSVRDRGAIVDNAREVGYALETQTKPVFDSAPDEETLAHEIAHQWFGDAVTLTQWPDIWLHEGFATLSEWLWAEHAGGQSAHAAFAALLARPATDRLWNPPPANPGDPAKLFGSRSTTAAR
jgi:Peptidase family M1 domain